MHLHACLLMCSHMSVLHHSASISLYHRLPIPSLLPTPLPSLPSLPSLPPSSLLQLFGAGVLILGVVTRVGDSMYFDISNDQTDQGILMISSLLIALGVFVVVVAGVGAVGAIFASMLCGRILLGLVSEVGVACVVGVACCPRGTSLVWYSQRWVWHEHMICERMAITSRRASPPRTSVLTCVCLPSPHTLLQTIATSHGKQCEVVPSVCMLAWGWGVSCNGRLAQPGSAHRLTYKHIDTYL